jgi:hypothetical protein
LADRVPTSQRRRRRSSPNLIALILLLALAGAALLWKQPWSAGRPDHGFPVDAPRELTGQFAQLTRAGSQGSYVEASLSASFGARLWHARDVLDVTSASFDYVRGATAADRSDGSALAVIQVDWTEGARSPFGRGERSTVIGIRVKPTGHGFAMQDVERVDRGVPPWLAGAITRSHADGADLIRIDDGGSDVLLRQLRIAAAAVHALGPKTSGSLVAVAPASIGQSAAILGQAPSDISQIAAVTTRLASDPKAPSAIVLNPAQFRTMDVHAQQVVLSHEATHQLTGAVGRGGEAWVIEGFADFVALHGDRRSVQANAAQALAAVRADGAPTALPTRADYANGTHGLGALYEATWLIFRMLGERYGDGAVIDFYDAVLGGTEVDRALHDAFGTTTVRLTVDWDAYLVGLAG